MTATVIARLDTGAVEELLAVRADYPVEICHLGLAAVARVCYAAREISHEALLVAEQLERDPLAVLDYADVAAFAEMYPALTRWRTAVLAKPRHQRDRLEAAAAYECQAVECERVGAMEGAAIAMQAAFAAVKSRRRSA